MDGINPVARTNVAPAVNPAPEPALYGFSYTVRSNAKRKTFVVGRRRVAGRLDSIHAI